jgi:hypothetical protein
VLALPPGNNDVSAHYSGDTPTGYFLPSATAMTTAQTVQALCATPPSPVGVSGDGFGRQRFGEGPNANSGGVIEGTINGGLNLRGAVTLLGKVVVNGDVNLEGGSLTMSCGSIEGDLNARGSSIVLSGGPISIGRGLQTREGSGLLVYGAQVADELQVQDTTAPAAPFAVCGTSLGGLQLVNSSLATPPTLGGATGTICGPDAVARDVQVRGDTLNGLDLANLPIGGGLQIDHNHVASGSLALSGGTVQRDVQVSDNAVPAGSIEIANAAISGGLQLQRNTVGGAITLSGGTVQRDVQVSDNSAAGSIDVNGVSVSGDLQLQRNRAGDSITLSGTSIGGDLHVDQNRASTGAISVLDNTISRDAEVVGNVAPLGVLVQGNAVSGHLRVSRNGTGQDRGGETGGGSGGRSHPGDVSSGRGGKSSRGVPLGHALLDRRFARHH